MHASKLSYSYSLTAPQSPEWDQVRAQEVIEPGNPSTYEFIQDKMPLPEPLYSPGRGFLVSHETMVDLNHVASTETPQETRQQPVFVKHAPLLDPSRIR